MLANHPKPEDIEISQPVQSDLTPSGAIPKGHTVNWAPTTGAINCQTGMLHGVDQEPEQIPGDTSTPPPQPSPSQPSSIPLQERALRYLERKRIRQERATIQIQSIQTNQIPISGDSSPVWVGTRFIASASPFTSTPPFSPDKSGICPPPSGASSPVWVGTRFIASASPLAPASPSTFPSTPYKNLTHTAQRHRKLLLRHMARKYSRRDRLDKQRSFQRLWITLLSMVAALIIIFLTGISGSTFIAYRFYTSTQEQYIPQVLTLRSLVPHDNLKMFDMNGTPIGQLTDEGIHTSIAYDQITPDVINATVSTEDKDFWNNSGIDIQRIVQAAVQDLADRRVVQGGSTITQQLIKNLVLRNPAQDITRKLQEVALTPEINSHYSKKDIMEMYLNSVYYGEQAYGVDAAASVYFGLEDQPGKPAASQLDLAQSAMLAGLPSAPSGDDPWINFDAAMSRLTTVLNLMHRNGYITEDQRQAALKEAQSPGFLKHPTDLTQQPAPHFFDFVLEQLEKQFHMTRQQLSLSDMRVYTTLDLKLQNQILQIAQNQIANLQSYNVTNAAEVLIDYHTGAVRTLLGNIHPDTDQFDVATQGYRQPGSSFKPYVYVTAFEQGASPGQAIDDTPISIPQPGQPPFTPQNYLGNFNGHMTLRCALQNSLNIPAVKVIEHVGVQNAVKTMQGMGVTDYKGDLNDSVALGSLDLHLIDHTSAIGTFADGGVHVPYYTIQKVEFANTHKVFEHPQNPGSQVISSQLAYMMTDVLSNNSDRVPEFGYCNPLNLRTDGSCYGPILPSAAKTGTTNDFRDNWTVGYTSDYVLGVWVGNDDNSPMVNINGITGAAPIWHDAMLAAEAGHSPQPFSNPGGLVKVEQHYSDGVATSDWFLAGQVPAAVLNPKKDSSKPTPPPEPKNKDKHHNQSDSASAPASARPYCSSYSFDFQPPANHNQPTDVLSPAGQDWW